MSTSLIGGFVIVAAFSLVVGLVGIRNMGSIDQMAEDLYQRELMGISYIKEANINLIYIGRDWRNALIASNPAERAKARTASVEHIKAVHDYIEKSRPLFVTEQGKATLKIPAGTQSSTTFRLKGRGMPHLRGNAHGDQLIRVHVEVPTHLTAEQRKILEEFARVSGDTDEPMAKSFFDKAKKFF